MPDREKVIKDLEECMTASCRGFRPRLSCPYNDEEWDIMRDALALLKEQEDGWISVDDRFPDQQGYYLVFIPGEFRDNIIVARYSFNQKLPWRGDQVHSGIEDVTHWMPLPKSPKGRAVKWE